MNGDDAEGHRSHMPHVSLSEIVEKTLGEIDELRLQTPQFSQQFSRPTRGRCPFNPVTGKKYNGWNAFYLLHEAVRNWYGDHRWLTSTQIRKVWEREGQPKNLPIHVRKGEKATHIARPVSAEKNELLQPEEKRNEDISRHEAYLKELEEEPEILPVGLDNKFFYYPVFNASQVENFPPFLEAGFKDEAERNEILDKFIASSGVKVRHAYDPVCPMYVIYEDVIVMPYPRAYSDNPAAYYADKMHEFFHATGHRTRENRCNYSVAEEEISAELFSVMVANMLDLPFSRKNAVGYLLPYHKSAVESGRRGIPELVQQPAKVLSILDDFIWGGEVSLSWFPDKSSWKELQQEQFARDSDLWVDNVQNFAHI